MTWAADFAWFQVNARGLLDSGFSGAVRYCVPGNNKRVTPDEFRDLTSTPGMALALVNETFAQAASSGYNLGRAEAAASFGYADWLGWPRDRPIYFVGEDPTSLPPPWPAIEEYFRGVSSVVAPSRVGYYGSARAAEHILALGLASYAWEVQTWPGAPSPEAHLSQLYYPEEGAPGNFAGQVDVNRVHQADWGQWTATAPVPTIGVPDMTPDESAKLTAVWQALTATDAARDDNGNPIPDHWAISEALAHARQANAKIGVVAGKVDALAARVGQLSQGAGTVGGAPVDADGLAAAILRHLGFSAPSPS